MIIEESNVIEMLRVIADVLEREMDSTDNGVVAYYQDAIDALRDLADVLEED